MDWADRHPHDADARFDGGDLDCGNGLLLLIRKHLGPLAPGQLLEILSTESSVEEDLPAWSRLTGNELVSRTRQGKQLSFLVCKGRLAPSSLPPPSAAEGSSLLPPPRRGEGERQEPSPTRGEGERAVAALTVPPLAVMGVGSWPRPRWMLDAIHAYLEGRLSETDFHATADDAVRLAVSAQERAGVDVITDGEQRRDNYASFVGSRLDNCQLIPITDLLPYVDDPETFEEELRALDVPAGKVHHPAVFGRLQRSRPLALHELRFARSISAKPVKIALPGPYLLTRTMWLECITDKVYLQREELARDVVAILRAEVEELLAEGAAVVQLDEPVLSEVVFGQPTKQRSFMCGALGARRDPEEELTFAGALLNEVLAGLPRDRLALHVCRGNWSRDEGVALAGDYRPLLPLLRRLPVGILFLEMCTPRAGELEVLADLPASFRLGLGMVNQKLDAVEALDDVVARAERAIELFGAGRVLLNPDCGFATFADSPLSPSEVAQRKLAVLAEASRILRRSHLQSS